MRKYLILLLLPFVLASCAKENAQPSAPDYDTLKLSEAVVQYQLIDNLRLTLDATYPQATSYLWQPNGETDPLIDVGEPGTYTVYIQTPGGQVVMRAEVFFYGTTFYAPNTFTPNNDAHNDVWRPVFFNVQNEAFDMKIFDSKNAGVFASDNISDCSWAGNNNPEGYYYFIIHYRTSAGEDKTESGMIQLIR